MNPMRKKATGGIAVAMLAGAVAYGGYSLGTAPDASAVAAEPYTFSNVEIHGGGFVPGVIFNEAEKDLIYARTDIGGAYRWNPGTGRWIPLTDWVSNADNNLMGIDGLATDPVDPDRLYLVAGTYTQSWAPNAAILRSTDRGATFERTDLPVKMGGNETGRSIGERIAIDPAANNVLYLGTRTDGLYKSTDFGASWAKVDSFPTIGQSGVGVGFITFAGSTVYVGTSDTAAPLYQSTDDGATWSPVVGQPTGLIPHHGRIAGDALYVTYGDQPGPYTMSNGSVWKLSPASGAWTDITPLKPNTNGEVGFGYAGLAVDAQDPNTIMVATMGRWGPVDDIFRSVDGGTSWISITANKVMDTSAAPYLNWHGTPKLGWMIGSLEIDPFNRDRVLFGTGATIFGSDDVTSAEAGGSTHWDSRAGGLEETSVQELLSPPSGAQLISALGDIGDYRHDDITTVPATGMGDNPILGTATDIDFAELDPNIVIKTGYASGAHFGYSTDGAKTWTAVATEPESPEGAGDLAVSADGGTFLWAPSQRAASYTTDRGASWTTSTGLPANNGGLELSADRVNPQTFHAYEQSSGRTYVSSDGGATFAAAGTVPSGGRQDFKAVPGNAGDLWVAAGTTGLHHSTDGGTSFAKVAAVTEASTVGFGMAAPGQSYPAIYLNGVVDGIDGVFRSDDGGGTWVRINDDQHQYAWIGKTITGDPRIYGRVYFGTNGRGIIYGDPVIG